MTRVGDYNNLKAISFKCLRIENTPKSHSRYLCFHSEESQIGQVDFGTGEINLAGSEKVYDQAIHRQAHPQKIQGHWRAFRQKDAQLYGKQAPSPPRLWPLKLGRKPVSTFRTGSITAQAGGRGVAQSEARKRHDCPRLYRSLPWVVLLLPILILSQIIILYCSTFWFHLLRAVIAVQTLKWSFCLNESSFFCKNIFWTCVLK